MLIDVFASLILSSLYNQCTFLQQISYCISSGFNFLSFVNLVPLEMQEEK